MLSELIQRKANTTWSYLYVESKKKKKNTKKLKTTTKQLIDTENRVLIAGREGEQLEGGENGWRKSKGTNCQL